jgi:hypothetical protein
LSTSPFGSWAFGLLKSLQQSPVTRGDFFMEKWEKEEGMEVAWQINIQEGKARQWPSFTFLFV